MDLGEFESCISSILVSTFKNFAELNFSIYLERWQRKKNVFCLKEWRPTFFELATTLKNLGAKWLSEKKKKKKKKLKISLGHLTGPKPYFEIKILRLGLWDPTQSICYFS